MAARISAVDMESLLPRAASRTSCEISWSRISARTSSRNAPPWRRRRAASRRDKAGRFRGPAPGRTGRASGIRTAPCSWRRPRCAPPDGPWPGRRHGRRCGKRSRPPSHRRGRAAQMLLGRDIAEHGAAEPADHRRADRRGDVVVTRRHIGGQRSQRIKGRLVAGRQLAVHVFLDLVHRHMAGAFDHHLHIVALGDLVQFPQRIQFGELRRVVGVGGRAGAQAIAQAERDVILFEQFADVFKMGVEEIFL